MGNYDQTKFGTRAIKAGEGPDPTTGALNTPIYETSTYAYNSTHEFEKGIEDAMSWQPGACLYSRSTNPTTMALERKIASLEGAEDAAITACGMAAVNLALLSNLNAGDHCIASDDIFCCTRSSLEDILPSKGIETDIVNVIDISNIEKKIRPNTKVIYLEVLSNPRLELADLAAIAELAHKNNIKFIVDNTFLSPYLLRPLEWGADMVVHSGTKYVVGHGDALCGLVSGTKEMVDRVRYYNDNLGTHISPFDSWLALRGVRTLHLRLKAQCENALAIAKYLQGKPEVELVRYPGLENHPQHELAKKMLPNGFGGMVSFHLKGGYDNMIKFVDSVKLMPIATSLGDVQTLIHPKHHEGDLIRLSVGCEDAADLIADLEQAFANL
ncbi:MAG: aminotransferase class V-fold PLP-dependent enzyme [Firmicutes bacterium]|nr:aminotransferase class V-fold PLP-dependent enzyme [Bacillota bacterium]